MTKKAIIFNVILSCGLMSLIAGCASVSDVVPTGPDTFMVAAHGIDGNGSGAAQKAIALKAANAYCQARTKQMQVVRIESVEPFFGRPPSADVQFRCE
jgi:glycerol-3-phosphate cytidylyltransferase-like family protein